MGVLSDKENPESAQEQFSPLGNWAGPLLSVFLTLAHPHDPLPLQIWAIACYFLLSALPLCSLCQMPALSEHCGLVKKRKDLKRGTGVCITRQSSLLPLICALIKILLIYLRKFPLSRPIETEFTVC